MQSPLGVISEVKRLHTARSSRHGRESATSSMPDRDARAVLRKRGGVSEVNASELWWASRCSSVCAASPWQIVQEHLDSAGPCVALSGAEVTNERGLGRL
jgi:hypothetical protein